MLLSATTRAQDKPATPRKPNIVFILADDLGVGDLGCYGQKKIKTPSLDRLAAEGIRFTQHYAGSTVCAPSRCSLLTGLHAGHMAIRGNREVQPEGQIPLPAGTTTIAKLLQTGGYRTACIGKWGLGMVGTSGDPRANGFDRFYGHLCQRHAHTHFPTYLWNNDRREELAANAGGKEQVYSHDLFTRQALDFVRDSRERPFFLYLAYAVPHLALQAPEEALAPYRGQWPDPPYDGKRGYRAHPTPRAAYAAMVSRMDRDIGRLLDLLAELKLADDTVVCFASDNGPTFEIGGADSNFFDSSAGLRGRKGSLYEGGIRTPLLVRWPGKIRPGSTTGHVSSFCDFLPTCAEIVGLKVPPGLDGVSYLPSLLGREQPAKDYHYWEIPEGPVHQAIRIGNWKAVYTLRTDKLELFDLATDPQETHDLAATHPDQARKLRQKMSNSRHENPNFPLRLAKAKPKEKAKSSPKAPAR